MSDRACDDGILAARWMAAAGTPAVAATLESVYARIAEAVAARGPACWASGRCCNFESAGHLLYVTGLEAAYTLGHAARRPGAREGLSLPQLSGARARGGCPFQELNLCSVHTVKPLGCRVYFCDRSAQEWQQELSERAIAEIRAIHDEYGIEYRYGEWRGMLAMFLRAGPVPRMPN